MGKMWYVATTVNMTASADNTQSSRYPIYGGAGESPATPPYLIVKVTASNYSETGDGSFRFVLRGGSEIYGNSHPLADLTIDSDTVKEQQIWYNPSASGPGEVEDLQTLGSEIFFRLVNAGAGTLDTCDLLVELMIPGFYYPGCTDLGETLTVS